MELQQAQTEDAAAIMEVIEEARAFLKAAGSIQWQRQYPALSDIEADIAKRQGYILDVDGAVAGYAAVITGEEPAYTAITDGNWSNGSLDYVTIHRLAMSDKFRGQGLTHELFERIFEMMNARGYYDFRIDTHEHNAIMRHIFEREGFVKRGIVQIEGERWAYQREDVALSD
ncbi:MAG: GNAT family N-acetyltransferase [Streptococcaceae bacterium]|jgi:GNAT superfamily N-acetyltransferase|nr:GNAT family N-acetyltransferase [Streptococcaceae bacterium]